MAEYIDIDLPITLTDIRGRRIQVTVRRILDENGAVYDAADVVEVVRCRDCHHRDPEDLKCDCGELPRAGCIFSVPDNYFCAYGVRAGGESNETAAPS